MQKSTIAARRNKRDAMFENCITSIWTQKQWVSLCYLYHSFFFYKLKKKETQKVQNLLSLQFLPELALTSLVSERHGWLIIIYSRFFPLRMQLSSTQQLLQLHIYTPGEAIIFIARGPWQIFFFNKTKIFDLYQHLSIPLYPKKKNNNNNNISPSYQKKNFFFNTARACL